MPRALIVEIFGNASQFAAELDKAAGKTRQFGRAAGVAGIAIAGGLAYGLEKSVKSAMAAQTSTARLDAAFKQSGQSATAYAGQIDKAESASRNLGFSNIDVRQSLGSLEIATHSGTQAVKDLGVAQDIARFKGIGLTDASKVLTMAMAGSQRATKQLGLTIQPVTSTYDALKATMKGVETAQQKQELAAAKAIDKQKTAKEVIALVTEKLHGQAQAYSQTAAGGMAQFHAQMEALQENLGSALLPSLTVLAQKLGEVTGWLAKHTVVAKIVVGVLALVAAGMIAVSIATNAANLAFLASPIGLIAIGLVALGVALVVAYQKSATFREVVQQAFAQVKVAFHDLVNAAQQFVGALEAIWRHIGSFIVPLLRGYFDSVKALVVGAFKIIGDLFTTFGDIIHGRWGNVWGDLKQIVVDAFNTVKGYLGGLPKALAQLAFNIGKAIFNGIMNGIGDIGGAILDKVKGGLGGIAGAVSGAVSGIGGHLGIGHHALGGIFNTPTIAMIGERGPEAVIPLNRAGLGTSVGGGAPTINVTVHGWVGSDQQIAQRLRNELVSLGRREPNIFAGYA